MRLIKFLLFKLTFNKEEQRAIREGLKYGEGIWFDSFKASEWKENWMNERRNYFSHLHDSLELKIK